jgi:hypothetical protein
VRREIPEPPPGLTAVDPRMWLRAWQRVIADPSVKLTGFALASFADYKNGSEVRPGNGLLMKVTGIRGDKTVRMALAQIREWGFIWRYSEGRAQGRRGNSDIYQLTFPDDISAVPMLSPDWETED